MRLPTRTSLRPLGWILLFGPMRPTCLGSPDPGASTNTRARSRDYGNQPHDEHPAHAAILDAARAKALPPSAPWQHPRNGFSRGARAQGCGTLRCGDHVPTTVQGVRVQIERGLLVLGAIASGGLLTACGDDSDKRAPSRQGAPASTQPVPEAERTQLANLAKSYFSAFAAHDWPAACRTRSPAERASLARIAGSCERSFELILNGRPGADQLFVDATIGDIRVQGPLAGIDVVQPGQTKPAITLAAVKRDGRWFLQDVADARTP